MKRAVLLLPLLLSLTAGIAHEPVRVVTYLKPDGSLKYNELPDGLLDFSGLQAKLDPVLGPVFSAALTPQWNQIPLGITGAGEEIFSILFYDGDLYVGGYFNDAGGNPNADHIARWDGCEWHALGSGLNQFVQDIEADGNDIYVGGFFTDAGGNPNADRIARWDGATWNNLGPGFDAQVICIGISSSGIYAGGDFLHSGTTPLNRIAVWDGTSWNAMGTGLNDYPLDMATNGNDVYVGGFFTDAGGNPDADYIARWNGSAWLGLGMGLNAYVRAIENDGNDIYMTGNFTDAGGNPEIDFIAYWDGNTWHAVGDFFDSSNDRTPIPIFITDQFVYVGSHNEVPTGGYDFYIMQWDLNSETWTEYPPNYPANSGSITGLAWDGANLYAISPWDNLWRWGEPIVQIEITGVPDTICLDDPPLALPTTQSGYTGDWSGLYVNNNVFDPEYSGNHQLIFTPDIPCAVGVPFIITVLHPEFYLDLPPAMCQTDPPLALADVISGISGEWSGTGVVNNIFYPAGLNGDIAITFTPDPGQCAGPMTGVIEVSPWITIVIMGVPTEVCESDNPVYLNPEQSGITGWWYGEGVEWPSHFNPEGLSGSITLNFVPEMGECASETTFDIFVFEAEIPGISGVPDSICQQDAPVALPTNQSGVSGYWSGTGVSNNIFNPAGLLGYITLTFNPDAGTCAFSATTDVWVYVFTPQISGIPSSICVDSDPIPLPVNQNGIMGNWSGPGVNMNLFDPEGQNGLVELLFSPDAGQCATTATFGITVNPLVVPIISGVPSSICEEASPIALPVNQSGFVGTWSGPGVSMNAFDPVGQNGLVELIYTPDPGQCGLPNMHTINVDTAVTPIISELPSNMCEELPPIPLPVIQNGFTGNWSGPGVNMNTFDPDGLNGLVELTFTPDAGYCAVEAYHFIDVFQSAIPDISGVPSDLCEDASPIILPVNQNGFTGNWSGPGVVSNTFNPEGQSGNVTIHFIPDPGQCGATASWDIEVYLLSVPVLSGIPDTVCSIAAPVILPVNQNGYLGNWSGPGVDSNIFYPDSLTGLIQIFFEPDTGQCAVTASTAIQIEDPVQPVLQSITDTLCQLDSPIMLSPIQDGFSGQWSGPGVSNNTFSPFGLSGAVMLIFTPDSEQCAHPAGDIIVINPVLFPTITGIPSSICASGDSILLPTVQNGITGTWTGTGVNAGYFNPAGLLGNQTLLFTPSADQCAIAISGQIDVVRSPRAKNLVAVCDSSTHTYTISFEITGGDSSTYMVNGIPVEGAHFISPPISADSTHYTFVLEDANGCIPFAVTGQFDCSCATSAGTMGFDGSPRIICTGPRFVIGHNADAHLDPDDVLNFVIHDNAGNILGNVFAINGEPVFTYIPGMVPGQLYFISAVAGNQAGNGSIDFTDPCLSVSPGVPVVFRKCEPDEDNIELQPVDPVPFTGDEHEMVRPSNNVLHGIAEGKMEIRYSTMLISDHEPFRDAAWASLEREDPMAMISDVTVYDLWGRKVLQGKGISISAYRSGKGDASRMADLIPGYYVLLADIDMSHGGTVRVIGRCLVQ